MHVVVLGAGITGATTAYYLAEQGFAVTILDRASAPASLTSYANGGQLSYSHTDSLARPEFIPKIPALLLGLDPAIRVGVYRNHHLVRWGLEFLGQCTHGKARANTLAVLKIALRSAALLGAIRENIELDFSYRAAGKLVVLADRDGIEGVRRRSELKRENGCDTRVVDYEEALALEPALAAMRQKFAAAVYSPGDHVGDANAFAAGMVQWLEDNRPVSLRLNENVRSIEVRGSRVRGVVTDAGEIDADAAVVCLGPWSAALLRPHGIDPRIYPVRGYSVTLPRGSSTPAVSVTSLEHRIVFSLLGDRVRIAGFADFVGYETGKDDRRRAKLLEIAERIAPEAADYGAREKHPWGGFRPVTPSGRPVVGPSGIGGLYLNTGHGVLGWTLACATGHDVARTVAKIEKRSEERT